MHVGDDLEQGSSVYEVAELEINAVSGLPPGVLLPLPQDALPAMTEECLPLFGAPTEPGLYEVQLQCNLMVDILGSIQGLPLTLSHWILVPSEVGVLEKEPLLDGQWWPQVVQQGEAVQWSIGTDLERNFETKIYDARGQLLVRMEHKNEATWQASGSGMVFIHTTDGTHSVRRKVIIR